MLWTQLAGVLAIVSGLALIVIGLFENPDFPSYEELSYENNHNQAYSEYGGYPEYETDTDRVERHEKRKTEFGGVVLIGPIPIVFGNDKRAAILAVVLTMLLMLMTFLLFFGFVR